MESLAKFVSIFCGRKDELTKLDYINIKSLEITEEMANSIKNLFPKITENKLEIDEIPQEPKSIENIKPLLRYYYYNQKDTTNPNHLLTN